MQKWRKHKAAQSAKPMDDTISRNTNMWFWRTVRLGAPTGSMPQSNVLTSHFKQQHPIPHNFRDPGDISKDSKGWASASPSPETGLIPESWHFRIDTNKQAFQVSTSSKNDHGSGVIWFSLIWLILFTSSHIHPLLGRTATRHPTASSKHCHLGYVISKVRRTPWALWGMA